MSFHGEGAEDDRPQIEAFAIPSVPPPPAWPQSERIADQEDGPEAGKDPPGAGAASEEEEPEPVVEEAPADSGDSPVNSVQPPPPPPPPSEDQGAGSGGWVTGGRVGG